MVELTACFLAGVYIGAAAGLIMGMLVRIRNAPTMRAANIPDAEVIDLEQYRKGQG